MNSSSKQDAIDLLRRLPQWAPPSVVTVGASGGIASRWNVFGGELTAIGFDPLVAEIARLNGQETRPGVRYDCAWIGSDGYSDGQPHIQPYTRSTAHQLSETHIQNHYNAGAPVVYTERRLSLDDACAGRPTPDAVVIDTDGSELDVLRGAESLLSGALSVELETQFHRGGGPEASVFSNTDAFLRARGFQLFDLKPHRYSRSALPAVFAKDAFMQTVSGQVVWADTVYLRDLAAPTYTELFAFDDTPARVLTLCALFIVYNLPDCAAELLTTHGALRGTETAPLLDRLTPTGDYAAYVSAFAQDPTAWYASRQPRKGDRMKAMELENERLRARIDAYKRKLRGMRERDRSERRTRS